MRESRGEAEPSRRIKIKIQTKCNESQKDRIEGSQDKHTEACLKAEEEREKNGHSRNKCQHCVQQVCHQSIRLHL